MKTYTCYLILSFSLLFSNDDVQSEEVIEIKKVKSKIENSDKNEDESSNQKKLSIDIYLDEDDAEGDYPKLGVYTHEIDFHEAYELHYTECFGVLLSGIISGGNAENAGLLENDIIMYFDGEKVLYEDHLLNLRNMKNYGDTVEIKFFRNEKIMTTELTFQPPKEHKNESFDFDEKLSVGFGGGGPMTLIMDYNFPEINAFATSYGFSGISAKNAVFHGGYGGGNVGGGFFVGGMGAGLEINEKNNVGDKIQVLNLISEFGGFTVNKKIALFTEKLLLDFGTLIGWGETSISMGEYSNNVSWDGTQLNDGETWAVQFKKGYTVLMPSAGVLVRVLPWMALQADYTYLTTFAADDKWKEKNSGINVAGASPPTLEGHGVNLKLWFGR